MRRADIRAKYLGEAQSTRFIGVAFESFSEMTERLTDKEPALGSQGELNDYLTKSRDGSWYGLPRSVQGWEQAFTYLTAGWEEGQKKIQEAVGSLPTPHAEDLRRRREWADQGNDLDFSRYFAGRYDAAWQRTRKRATRGMPRLRIMVDTIVPGYEDAENLIWRGAAAYVLASGLSHQGWQVEVVAGFVGPTTCAGDRLNFVSLMRAKGFGQPVNEALLCAMLAHPAVFRMAGHAQGVKYCPNHHGGYSVTRTLAELPDEIYRALGYAPAQTVYVPQTCLSPKQAKKWLDATLRDLEAKVLG